MLFRDSPPVKVRGVGGVILLVLILGSVWHQKALAPNQTSNPKLPLAQNTPPTTTLLAVGDIMLSRNVSTKIEKAADANLPFLNLNDFLASTDITFGNLECPLDPGNNRIYEGLVFRCLTKDFQGVISAGFDVLSTANNHSFDQSLDNLEFTVEYLKSQNIVPIGTRISPPREGELEGVITRNGVKFGFLAYSYSARNDGGKSTHPQISTMHDPEILKSEISNLKSNGADVIVVSMHAGYEYTRQPNQDQIDFAHAAIDAGADVVIGHHPHWVQTVEVYSPTTQLSPGEPLGHELVVRDPEGSSDPEREAEWQRVPRAESRGREVRTGIIFYSLGNFVFDQMWSQDTREGLMVELQISDFRMQNQGVKIQKAKLIPVIIENYCCPRLATETEKQKILKKIGLDSDTLTFSKK
ncbi:MAG: CapA family protein [bacterium]|nr:CapA family protein [bacterium]